MVVFVAEVDAYSVTVRSASDGRGTVREGSSKSTMVTKFLII